MDSEFCDLDHTINGVDGRETEFDDPSAPIQTDEARDDWAHQIIDDQREILGELSG